MWGACGAHVGCIPGACGAHEGRGRAQACIVQCDDLQGHGSRF